MKSLFIYIGDKFLSKKLDFRVRLFNILAMAGVIISFVSAAVCLLNGEGVFAALSNLATTPIAAGLLFFAARTGKYQLCYMITIVTIFLIFFPLIFFIGGGYIGAMPSYFIFAVVFTVFMLEGKKALVVTAVELAVYIGLCLFAWQNPGRVITLVSDQAVMIDNIAGFTLVSIVLGTTMFLHFRLYNLQQREMESAREEAMRFSEAKSRFLANMSHEIRTPINVMLGKNELILRESDSEQVREYSRGLQNAGDTLLTLVSNVLDMSKIEQGRFDITAEPYKTAELIDDLSAIGKEYTAKHGLAFHTQTDESLPCILKGDFLCIKQVAANFLSNAAKYTREGSVTLSVSGTEGAAEEEILLCIAVSDTGMGIKPETLSVIFDAFVRADMPGRTHIEGTGLGLAIAREFAELMGGGIFVESTWGAGSVFSLEVPQKVEDGCPLGSRDDHGVDECVHGGGFIAPEASVLIVDDNRENLQVARAMLSRMAMQADGAESGLACLEAVKSRRYDVIIMDYMMPGMDGVETLRRLREIPGFNTPALALTANVMAGTKEALQAAGFVKYLSKPIMWRDMQAALVEVLPGGKVIPDSAPGMPPAMDAETVNSLAKRLAAYGVVLGAGLKYLDGDMLQYRQLADFFTGHYNGEKSKIHASAEGKDWEGMRYSVHSLKSKAKAIGARELVDTATKLERLCTDVCRKSGKDRGEHIMLALATLFYEWERAVRGLAAFIVSMDGIIPPRERETPILSLGGLLALLKRNRKPDAMDALDRLISEENRQETAEALRNIREKVKAMQMREAEGLLLALMEPNGGESVG